MKLLDKQWQQRYWMIRHLEFLVVLAIYASFSIWRTPPPGTIGEALWWLLELLLGGLEVLIYLFLFLSLKYNSLRWGQTIRLLGMPTKHDLLAMRRLSATRLHKYGASWPQFGVVAGVLAGLLYFTHSRLILAVLLVVTEQQLIEPLRRVLPPAVLLLTASASETVTLHARISFTVRRLRAVALLKMARSHTDLTSVFAWADCFRTEAGEEWEEVVATFLRLVPLVVLDARVVTQPVIAEAKRTLVPDLAYKLILLVGESGERPLLDHPELQQWRFPLRQIPVVREAGLLTMLHFLTRSRERIPSADRPLAHILRDSGRWTIINRADWPTSA